ncbi:hypothetical protein BC567DRAFT_205883 [Phyllosticta citribraziliensis]
MAASGRLVANVRRSQEIGPTATQPTTTKGKKRKDNDAAELRETTPEQATPPPKKRALVPKPVLPKGYKHAVKPHLVRLFGEPLSLPLDKDREQVIFMPFQSVRMRFAGEDPVNRRLTAEADSKSCFVACMIAAAGFYRSNGKAQVKDYASENILNGLKEN